ncbi:hypothetical protein BJY52DRAFT_1222137 [Lactarius psammicola]|nr:hypothetical protein BJY52DRAFT_1222137 [Lactarius psammicola]
MTVAYYTKGGSDSLTSAENTEGQNLTSAAETKTGNTKAPPSFPRPPPDGNGNTVFAAVTNLNAHLITLHVSLQPRMALLLFSGYSDPCSMSALPLAARGTKLARISGTGIRAVMERPEELATVGLSKADDHSLEEAVVRARMGPFVSVKT